MLASLLRRPLRLLLQRQGYWVCDASVLPFGIDYRRDIQRLSAALRIRIEIFFDIGAHTGQTALPALQSFPHARVFAFEPHPATFAALSRTVTHPQFAALNVAMSDKAGKVPFYDYGELATCNSMVADSQYARHAGRPFRTIDVEAITVDAFCRARAIDRVDVLKIDTEGHELAVLAGARQLLATGRPMFIYAEFNTISPKPGAAGGDLASLAALLEPQGFQFVAAYPEYMETAEPLFVTSNALFVRPPAHR